jgi:type IX secretion system PorP/SprF family membrane protein
MKRYLLLFFILILFEAKGQDAHFSQFYSNPLYLSPSFAGSSEGTRVILNYRDQWPSIPGNFVTYSFSGDHYFKNLRSGMGLIFFADQAGGGKLKTINIGYLYSFKIPISRRFSLQPGLSAYYYNRKVDFSKLNFADQYFDGDIVGSSSENIPALNVQHADFAVSCLAYTANYWGGVTVDHLMKISSVLNQDSRYSSMRISVFGGTKYTIKRRTRQKDYDVLYATFSYRQQSKIKQLDIGCYYLKSPIMFGLWYRGIPFGNKYATSDALVYFLGVKTKSLTISYSYDMTIGPLISKTGGSHEIAAVYYINNVYRPVRRKYAQIPCPEL